MIRHHKHQLNAYYVFGADLHATFLFCMTRAEGKKSLKTHLSVVVPSWASTQDFCLLPYSA